MKKLCSLLLVFLMLLFAACDKQPANSEASDTQTSSSVSSASDSEEPSEPEAKEELRITEEELYDRVLGSWVGQTAGVVWGAKTEFWFQGIIMPEDQVLDIGTLDLNGVFIQDDLYVELPFMDAMKKYGVNCSLGQIANEFKNTTFGLDHANKIARENLQKGIEAPLSGSYLNNFHCDDIDWQIEADFLGSIYPCLVNESAKRAFELGHITNYGDGAYGGVFVVAMHAAAFYAKSVDEIITAGVSVIPEGTKFREMMDDVIAWHAEGLTWQENWQKLYDKWEKTKRCLWYANGTANIDAKMNSAYILMGLLYGNGDFDESMRVSMMCGQDSDCNPSSVGAILGTYYGYKGIDAKWKKIDMQNTKFVYTNSTFEDAVKLNYTLALEMLRESGFEKSGDEWIIKYNPEYTPVEFEQWPDLPTIEASVNCDGNDIVTMSVNYHDINGIKSVIWDLGDGTVYNGNTSAHQYSKTGMFTVTCTVTNNNNNSASFSKEIEVKTLSDPYKDPEEGTYRNIAKNGTPICTDYLPTGSGSKDLAILYDGVKSGGNLQQYDTYAGYLGAHDEHVGYLFRKTFNIDKIIFTDGMHFNNGGWFIGETLKVEALINGTWTELSYTSDPAYPTGNVQGNYGANFQSYTFSFEQVTCNGIRIRGDAGGDAGFVGIAELEVYGNNAG